MEFREVGEDLTHRGPRQRKLLDHFFLKQVRQLAERVRKRQVALFVVGLLLAVDANNLEPTFQSFHRGMVGRGIRVRCRLPWVCILIAFRVYQKSLRDQGLHDFKDAPCLVIEGFLCLLDHDGVAVAVLRF